MVLAEWTLAVGAVLTSPVFWVLVACVGVVFSGRFLADAYQKLSDQELALMGLRLYPVFFGLAVATLLIATLFPWVETMSWFFLGASGRTTPVFMALVFYCWLVFSFMYGLGLARRKGKTPALA